MKPRRQTAPIVRTSAGILLIFVSLFLRLGNGQQNVELSQEMINNRVAEIIQHALQVGVVTTPEGVRATPMKAHISIEESEEIKKFGDRAIAPLCKWLDSSNARAQLLVVNLLGSIGGKSIIKPLARAAEKAQSPAVRLAALLNLDQQAWQDIAELVKRIYLNDQDGLVKKTAKDIIEKHAVNVN